MSGNTKFTKNVNIAGKVLTLSTDISDEHLDDVSEYVNKKFEKINSSRRIASQSSIGIALSVEICDEYFIEKNKFQDNIKNLNEKIKQLEIEYDHNLNTKTEELINKHKSEILKLEDEIIKKKKKKKKFSRSAVPYTP